MINLLLFFIILFTSTSLSQEKYFIYFKDKGVNPDIALNKTSKLYKQAEKSLSEKSIQRRKKTLGNNYITFGDLPVNREYIRKIEESGIKIERRLKWFNSVSAYLNEEQKSIIKSLDFVERIEPVKVFYLRREATVQDNLRKIKSDLNYGPSLPQLQISDIPEVHSKGIYGKGILIGLLDSGFDWQSHESLQNRNVIAEYDFVFNDSVTSNQPEDRPTQHNHGTAVFSAIGGYKEGVLIGPAFGADYILSKTEDLRSETKVEEDNYAAALIWMEEYGVDITSSSLGYSDLDDEPYTYEDMDGSTTIVTRAAEEAFARGVVTITSAGNEGNTMWRYVTAPADGFNTIAVGAVNNENLVAGFSSMGPTYDGRIKPEIVAQGVSVYAAVASSFNDYYYAQGTSLSAPLASGCAALLMSAHPHLLNIQVRDILLKTADNYDTPDFEKGYGLVSAADAINFPNLEKVENSYKLHKIFIRNNYNESVPVQLHYFYEGSDTFTAAMLKQDSLRFNYIFPSFSPNQKIYFYLTFSDSSGNIHNDPSGSLYSFSYGELIISKENEVNFPVDYVLSNNYPNPFNNRTKIDFYASPNEKAEIIIFNILGEKIRTLYNGFSREGKNTVEWDGRDNSGSEAAGGVYFYTLKLRDKDYVKKMIFLK